MRNRQKIRILLVDDHSIVREGYRALLARQDNMQVIAEATEGAQAYRLCNTHAPDVVIMDLSLPGQGGLETIARLRRRSPQLKILVFSMHQNTVFALQAMRAGANGYISKSSEPEVLIRAVGEVYQGRLSLSSDIAQLLALEKLGNDRIALGELSVREFEILRMLAEARTTDDIAHSLHISPKTVANCHYLIKRKLNVKNDIELTRLAIKMKLVAQP